MSDLRIEINWQISLARGWKLEPVDCDCYRLTDPAGVVVETSRHMQRILEAEIDWHGDAHWPTLFRELPLGTVLLQPIQEVQPVRWSCCGCYSQGSIRVCQPADSVGEAVCKAWLAFQLGKQIYKHAPDFMGVKIPTVPHSGTVH